jgi:hypothetical protein
MMRDAPLNIVFVRINYAGMKGNDIDVTFLRGGGNLVNGGKRECGKNGKEKPRFLEGSRGWRENGLL